MSDDDHIYEEHPQEEPCEFCFEPILGMEMAIDHFSREHPNKPFDPTDYMLADIDKNIGNWVMSEYT